MLYPDFSKYQPFVDPQNPLVNAYRDSKGNSFYVEPGFYSGLMGFKEKRPDAFAEIMSRLEESVKKYHRVVFTADFESPFIEKAGYVYKEVSDLSDPLGVFVEDKNRPSDYGD